MDLYGANNGITTKKNEEEIWTLQTNKIDLFFWLYSFKGGFLNCNLFEKDNTLIRYVNIIYNTINERLNFIFKLYCYNNNFIILYYMILYFTKRA